MVDETGIFMRGQFPISKIEFDPPFKLEAGKTYQLFPDGTIKEVYTKFDPPV